MSLNINIAITAKDQASKTVKSMTDSVKKQTSALSKTFDGLRQAGSMAAGMLMRDMVQGATQALGEVIQLGGEVDTLKNSFERLVAASGDTSLTLEDLQKATQGTVADVDLLQAANQALMLGLPTENLDEMMGSAIKLGHAMGIDAKKAVESLTTGIGRQSKMILDNLGVVFDAQEAYDWYAESLGTTADQLDEAQKKEAWMAYAIEQVNQKAEELGDVTSEAQTAQERWNATLTNLKTSLGKMLGPLGAIAPALEGFMPMMGTMASTMLPNLIQGMGGFGGVVSSVTGLLPSFGSIMSISVLGPIGLVAIAIAGLYLAWQNNWGGIRDILGGAASFIQQTIGWIINNPFEALKKALFYLATGGIGILYDAWVNNWGGIRDIVSGALESIGIDIDGFASSVQTAWDNFCGTVQGAWNTAWSSMQSFISNPIGSIQSAVSGLGGWLQSSFSNFMGSVKGINDAALNAIKGQWPAAGTFIESSQSALHSFLTGDWGALAESLKTMAQSGLQAIKDLFTNIWGAIRDFLKPLWDMLPGDLKKALTDMFSFATEWLNKILGVFTGIFDQIRGALEGFWNWLTRGSMWPDMFGDMLGIATGWLGDISSAFTSGLEGIKSTFEDAWGTVSGTVSGALDSAKGAVEGFIDSAGGAIDDFCDWLAGGSIWPNTFETVAKATEHSFDRVLKATKDTAKEASREIEGFSRDLETGFTAQVSADLRAVQREVEGPGRVARETPTPVVTENKIVIRSPLVNIEGSADRRTAELAAELVEKRLRTVIIENTSSGAPTKRIEPTTRRLI